MRGHRELHYPQETKVKVFLTEGKKAGCVSVSFERNRFRLVDPEHTDKARVFHSLEHFEHHKMVPML